MRYKTFYIPKRNGKKRKIEAPDDELKKVQYKLIKTCKLFRLPPGQFAHGFIKGRNVATAMMPHVNKKYVIKFDIKDFFNSIKLPNTKLTCKETPFDMKTLKPFFKCKKKNCNIALCYKDKDQHLPQGAPTSPTLANLYLWNADYKIAKTLAAIDVDYTRYVDEIILSSNSRNIFVTKTIIKNILKPYNLELNDEKTRVFKNRKCVLSIVVNKKLNIPRTLKKNLRAAQHQVKHGREMDDKLKGELAYTNMILNNDKYSMPSTQYYKNKEMVEAL